MGIDYDNLYPIITPVTYDDFDKNLIDDTTGLNLVSVTNDHSGILFEGNGLVTLSAFDSYSSISFVGWFKFQFLPGSTLIYFLQVLDSSTVTPILN